MARPDCRTAECARESLVTIGAAFSTLPQPPSKRKSGASRSPRRFTPTNLEIETNDETSLDIRFIRNAGRLEKNGRGGKCPSEAERGIRADIDSVLALFFPFFKLEFVEELRADEEPRADLIADAEALFEDTDFFFVVATFPFGLHGRVISDDPRAEVLLKDEFAFEDEDFVAELHFTVEGAAEEIGGGIGEIVDHFHADVFPVGLRVAAGFFDGPVGEIKAELQAVGEADLEFVAEVELVGISAVAAACLPSDPGFEFNAVFWGGGHLVAVGETTFASSGLE